MNDAGPELIWHSAVEMAKLVRTRRVSPVELMDACLARLAEVNPALGAVSSCSPQAREEAQRAEISLRQGRSLGPFHGVPFTVKDSFDTKGLRTTRGSRIYSDYIPAADAEAVRRLREAGAILIGKTNTPEFTLWTETDNLVSGRTRNPWSLERSPGGSSGGEAAAIAAGISPMGLGSDLSGSIRLPAHYCGIVGFKPTHGTVPLDGHFPAILDEYCHAGPMARTVADVRAMYAVLSGNETEADIADPVRTIGVLAGDCFGRVDDDVAAALETTRSALEGLGCRVDVLTRSTFDATGFEEVSLALFAAESSGFLNSLTPDQIQDLHPLLKARLSRPLPQPGEVTHAQERLQSTRRSMATLLGHYHALVAPVSPTAAPEPGNELVIGTTVTGARAALAATLPFSLGGYPAISVPVMLSTSGLPVGIQIIGSHGNDYQVLDVAASLECARGVYRPRI